MELKHEPPGWRRPGQAEVEGRLAWDQKEAMHSEMSRDREEERPRDKELLGFEWPGRRRGGARHPQNDVAGEQHQPFQRGLEQVPHKERRDQGDQGDNRIQDMGGNLPLIKYVGINLSKNPKITVIVV
jgi:hypothetical protein